MNCERAIQVFLSLDNGEAFPEDLKRHLESCPTCARTVRLLQSVFTALSEEGLAEAPVGSTDLVMASVRISARAEDPEERLSMGKWLVAGVIMFASVFLVSFSDSHMWLRRVFGMSLEVPLSLILGAAMAIYASLFIGTHIDKVADFFGLRRR
jgi:hypothetical protein